MNVCIKISVFSQSLFHLHTNCFRFIYAFSSELYFGIENSCSARIIQINQIFLKSNPVVIIFVAIIISAFSKFSRALFLSFFVFTASKSNLKILISSFLK
jgi:hypothetical protein